MGTERNSCVSCCKMSRYEIEKLWGEKTTVKNPGMMNDTKRVRANTGIIYPVIAHDGVTARARTNAPTCICLQNENYQ